MAVAARMLGRHLGADRCAYAEVEDESVFVITGNYTDGVPSIVGRWPVAAFGPELVRLMAANEPYVMDDVEADPRAGTDLSAYRATTIRAVICVPLHKGGKFTAAMAVHQKVPRRWTPEEIRLVCIVVGRCWESIERARVARDLRESEERQRTARRQPALRLHLPDRPRGRRLPPLHLCQRGRGGALRGDAGGGGRGPGEPLRAHRGGGPASPAGRGGGSHPGPEAVRLPVPRAGARRSGALAALPLGTARPPRRLRGVGRHRGGHHRAGGDGAGAPRGRSEEGRVHRPPRPRAQEPAGPDPEWPAGDATRRRGRERRGAGPRHDGPAARAHGATHRRPARRLPDRPEQDGTPPRPGARSPTSSATPWRPPAP